MKGSFVIPSNRSDIDRNIYADKSSLILYWLLLIGIDKEQFSIREVAKECNLSVGLVQRVFKILTLKGYIQTEGIRTAKKFRLKNPEALLESWAVNYSIVEKCKIWTYRSAYQNKEQIVQALIKNNFEKKVVLTLHSSADFQGYKNSNLDTVELYILQSDLRLKIEEKLLLEPQEKGYEIILIEPYYKSLLEKFSKPSKKNNILCSPVLLNYLDLYHFPLRGKEQAQFIAERSQILKKINKKQK